MPKRYYLAAVVPGPRSLRPAIAEFVNDWRETGHTAPGNPMLVEAEVSDAEHATLIADPRITAIPFPIDLDAPISTITAASRTAVQNLLEAIGVSIGSWVTGATTPREILKFSMRVLLVRQADDWNEGLDTLMSDIPGPNKARGNAILRALGFNTGVINGSDTIRVARRKLAQQNIPALKTHLD